MCSIIKLMELLVNLEAVKQFDHSAVEEGEDPRERPGRVAACAPAITRTLLSHQTPLQTVLCSTSHYYLHSNTW